MIFQPRFFFQDGANENGGGNDATATAEGEGNGGENNNGDDAADQAAAQAAADAAKPAPVEKIELTLEEAKSYGFDSKEQMLEHFKNLKEQNRSEEQKAKEKALDDANFRKFSIENDLLKEDDFMSHQSLSAKADHDLVFEKYLTEFKEDNPDLENDPELTDKAKAEFNREYRLDSQSEKVKQRGLEKLQKEAKEMRSPVQSKFEAAQSQYKLAKDVAAEYPKFEEFLTNKVRQHTPDKVLAYSVKDGETTIDIEIDITEEDRKQMAKEFTNNKNFYKFKQEDRESFEKSIDSKMQAWVELNKAKEIRKKTFERGVEIGQQKGSNVGADNPFPLVDKNSNKQQDSDKTLEQQIRESHNRAAKI